MNGHIKGYDVDHECRFRVKCTFTRVVADAISDSIILAAVEHSQRVAEAEGRISRLELIRGTNLVSVTRINVPVVGQLRLGSGAS
jgi:hypothetical protein